MQQLLRGLEPTRDEINRALKRAADLIRTRVDYKYILILLFVKRLSDEWRSKFEDAVRKLKKEGLPEEQVHKLATDKSFQDFNYPEEYTWDKLRENINDLPINLSNAMKKLGELNSDLQGVVDRLDFMEFTRNMENFEILRQLFETLSGLELGNASPDVLGDAYEWILEYFAPQKAKEGEVYTPEEVIKLLIEILDPGPMDRVYDPAAGAARMLIGAYYHAKERYGDQEAKKLFLYGQEVNSTTFAIGKMNAIIHGIKDINMEVGDTLLNPKFKDGEVFRRFDIVIANPPWNQDGYGQDTLKKAEFRKERYDDGYPPNSSADWAWIQHMLASATNDGKVGIVLDAGVLFRGGSEKTIRTKLLKYIECVILLPEKLFYNTGAPGIIMILNRNRLVDRKGKVLFINASGEYRQHPEVRKLNQLGDEHIGRIGEAYKHFKDEEGFSRGVPLDEITEENDCNLNVTLYVFPKEEVEDIDVEAEWRELANIEKEISQVNEKIKEYLIELGIRV